jgi:hypothetical protein
MIVLLINFAETASPAPLIFQYFEITLVHRNFHLIQAGFRFHVKN